MKLFGDTGKHLHAQKKGAPSPRRERTQTQPAPREQPAAEPVIREQPAAEPTVREQPAKQSGPAAEKGASKSQVWKKLRIPAIILGAIILLALVVVVVYSIWEKPPEVKQTDGPTIQPTVQPVIQTPEPVKETAEQPPEPTQTPPAIIIITPMP